MPVQGKTQATKGKCASCGEDAGCVSHPVLEKGNQKGERKKKKRMVRMPNAVPMWNGGGLKRVRKETRKKKRSRNAKGRRMSSRDVTVSVTHSLHPSLSGSESSAQFRDSDAISQPGNTTVLQRAPATSAHSQSTPGATPELVLVIRVADGAFDGSMFVARGEQAAVRAIALELRQGQGRRVGEAGGLELVA